MMNAKCWIVELNIHHFTFNIPIGVKICQNQIQLGFVACSLWVKAKVLTINLFYFR